MLVALLCGRLGIWQLDRLGERRARNAIAESHLALPPVRLIEPTVPDSLHYRRVDLSGVFDFERQIVVVARSYQGVPGVYVVTPLVLGDRTAALVERGWVPSPDGRTVDLEPIGEPDSARVEGVLLVTNRDDRLASGAGWPLYVRSASPSQLADRLPYSLVPLVVRRTGGTPAAEGLRAIPLPQFTNGPHLSYAVQWFTFGLIALVGGLILFGKGVGSRE